VDARWTQGGRKVDARWTQGGRKVDARWTQGGRKVGSRLAQGWLKMDAHNVVSSSGYQYMRERDGWCDIDMLKLVARYRRSVYRDERKIRVSGLPAYMHSY
jgi:hypothetical protein